MPRYGDLDALKTKVEKLRPKLIETDDELVVSRTVYNVCEIISKLPAADVMPVVHGRWIKKYDIDSQDYNSDNNWYYVCSVCGKGVKHQYPNCPWCTAKMDLEE